MKEKRRKSISLEELLELDNALEPGTGIPNIKKEKYSKKELLEAKKGNKFYLPVLNLNDSAMWPPRPKSQRQHLTDKTAKETCLTNCCGQPGLWSACCRLDPDDTEHVLGPIPEKWIKKILRHFRNKGYNWSRSDIVIDFEEGKYIGDKFFNGRSTFHEKTSYPMLRFQVVGNAYGCKFLNPNNGICTIYQNRPPMCENYFCKYIKSNFLIRTRQKPNTYRIVDT